MKAQDSANAGQIAQILNLLQKESSACRSVAGGGQVDCVGRSLARVAKAIPARGTLSAVKKAVARSAEQLNRIVRQNGQRGAKVQGFVPIRQEAVRISATKANTVLRQLAIDISRIAPPAGATKELAQIRRLAQQIRSMKVAAR